MDQAKALAHLKSGRNVLLTGPAGSGKTFLLNQFIDSLKAQGKKVAITASTGIAATHLGGTTIHSWSGIGIAQYLSEFELDALAQKEYLYKRFNGTDVLIIDEISMFDAPRLDAVDAVLRKIRNNSKPFGGIQVVLSGDFFQLPPVTRDTAPVQFAFQSQVWERMEDLVVCYLDFVYRQTDDPLLGILQEIRTGELTEGAVEQLQKRLSEKLPADLTPTKLYTHNADVDLINAAELKKIPGAPKLFHMTHTGKKEAVALLKKYCMAPEELVLKVGAVVMCVKNNSKLGYVNGTLGTVIGFEFGDVIIRTSQDEEIAISPETWAMEQEGKTLGKITQFPLRLAWAITVHKSQGMTMDVVEVDLSKSFAPGMGYVALSRVRTLAGLYLRGINQQALAVDPRIQAQDLIFLKQSRQFDTVAPY